MDFWDATKVLFRRWYLTIPLLFITLGVTAYTGLLPSNRTSC